MKTAQYQVHWIVVDIGVLILTFGMQLESMPCELSSRTLDDQDLHYSTVTAYIIDAYKDHVSSAMAATQFAKSLTAFLFPLFAPSMYRVLGYGWANSVLALATAVLFLPLTWLVWRCGARLRNRAVGTY